MDKSLPVGRVLPPSQALFSSTILALVLATAAARSEETIPAHLEKAKQIAEDIAPENNLYAHKDIFIRFKGGLVLQHENKSDCSGFVNLLFAHVYAYSTDDFQAWFGRKRPVARNYFETITAAKGFTAIAKVSEIEPGDILAIKYPRGASNTGHVMIAAAKPEKLSPPRKPMVDAVQWQLEIIDSSASPHGSKDTRRLPGGTDDTGVGRGTLRLYSDKSGAIVGYCWSTSANSEFHETDQRPIAVGRLIKDFKPGAPTNAAADEPDEND